MKITIFTGPMITVESPTRLGLVPLLLLFMSLFIKLAEAATEPTADKSQAFLPDGHLNLVRLKASYEAGDFDFMVEVLEPYLQKGGRDGVKSITKPEKIFAYKYLSVIHAASPETKAKAEGYMYQLLTLAPQIELVDLYVPAAIEKMFREVKAEFERRNAYRMGFDEFGQPLKTGPQTEPQAVKKSDDSRKERERRWVWWGTGAAILITGVVTAVFLIPEAEQSRDTVFSAE